MLIQYHICPPKAALASIITRCPKLTLVPDALLQLDRFYNVAMRYPSAEGTFVGSSRQHQPFRPNVAPHHALAIHLGATPSCS
jgi:hypothetical protein